MRREGWSFMGDDWAFLAEDAQLLGYEKPMFIKPHHQAIYPHLFEGARKPLVPVAALPTASAVSPRWSTRS